MNEEQEAELRAVEFSIKQLEEPAHNTDGKKALEALKKRRDELRQELSPPWRHSLGCSKRQICYNYLCDRLERFA